MATKASSSYTDRYLDQLYNDLKDYPRKSRTIKQEEYRTLAKYLNKTGRGTLYKGTCSNRKGEPGVSLNDEAHDKYLKKNQVCGTEDNRNRELENCHQYCNPKSSSKPKQTDLVKCIAHADLCAKLRKQFGKECIYGTLDTGAYNSYKINARVGKTL